jgi:hypothetical protein
MLRDYDATALARSSWGNRAFVSAALSATASNETKMNVAATMRPASLEAVDSAAKDADALHAFHRNHVATDTHLSLAAWKATGQKSSFATLWALKRSRSEITPKRA